MSIYVPWLADACRSAGLRTVEVPGWRGRGHGGFRVVEGVVGHHTATSAKAPGDYPSLAIVTSGRADLAGPLCNVGLGRDGTAYVVAGGVAWHAGASVWAGFSDLNDEFLGVEMESPGDGTWTAAQVAAAPKLYAALLRYMHRDASRYAGHKDVCLPAGRKIDPRGGVLGDRAQMQAKIAAILRAPAGRVGAAVTPITPREIFDMPGYSFEPGTNVRKRIPVPAGGARSLVNASARITLSPGFADATNVTVWITGVNDKDVSGSGKTAVKGPSYMDTIGPFSIEKDGHWAYDVPGGALDATIMYTCSGPVSCGVELKEK